MSQQIIKLIKIVKNKYEENVALFEYQDAESRILSTELSGSSILRMDRDSIEYRIRNILEKDANSDIEEEKKALAALDEIEFPSIIGADV